MIPIDPTPADMLLASSTQATVPVAPCEGCGGLPHGSVTAELVCLRKAVRELRERAGQIGGGHVR